MGKVIKYRNGIPSYRYNVILRLINSKGGCIRMNRSSANRDDEDAIYVGRSNVRRMQFPGAIEYSPDGYSQ